MLTCCDVTLAAAMRFNGCQSAFPSHGDFLRCADQAQDPQGAQELSATGVQASHAKRLRLQLAALDTAHVIDDLDIHGFGLHLLKGPMRGRWAISVNGNWRVTFEFKDGNAYVLDYEDYH